MSVENKNQEDIQDSLNKNKVNLTSSYPGKKDGEIERMVGY